MNYFDYANALEEKATKTPWIEFHGAPWNKEYAIHCVNTHGKLRKLLKKALNYVGNYGPLPESQETYKEIQTELEGLCK